MTGGPDGKEYVCNAGDLGWEDPLEKEIGYPRQYSWASLVAQIVKLSLQCGRSGFDP